MAASRAAWHGVHVVEHETEQDGLLQPLVDDPFAAQLLGDPRGAAVEGVERLVHGVADGPLGLEGEFVTAFPRVVDGGLGVGHWVQAVAKGVDIRGWRGRG